MTATRGGRPLRFFALLMIGWVTARLVAHLGPPDAPGPDILPQPPALAARFAPDRYAGSRSNDSHHLPAYRRWIIATTRPPLAPTIRPALPVASLSSTKNNGALVDFLEFIRFTTAFANRRHASDAMTGEPTAVPVPAVRPTPMKSADRWRGSGWLLWRPGSISRADVATVGRLGGSQAGLRVDYLLAPGAPSRPAAYARLTSALESPAAQEGAIGLAVQPFRALPVSFAIERRVALGDGSRNAMAILAAGGFGSVRVAPGVDAEAYVQAGLVGFHRRDAFVDGKMSLLSPIAKTPLRIGAALSGGAQPGVERLDIGPEIQVRLPILDNAARLSIEWRERIAGKAAPASGLAVTLAADF